MKRVKNLCKMVVLLLALQQNVFAQDNDNKNDNGNVNDSRKKYEFVKTKAINKSYSVSASDKLNIKNSFGKVEVHTWNKNEIKVDVNIEVSANTEALAQKIIDKIKVDEGRSGGDISFKTIIDNINNTKDEKSTMHIDYDISMPAGNPLRVMNEFGKTVLPDMKGEVEVSSKFGSLNAGTLSNAKSVNVEFGHADIESVTNGPVSIKYSSADIGKLAGNIKLNLEFSSATKINIDNSLTGLDANVSYSTINLKPTADVQASYKITTSFGSFKNRTNIKFDGEGDDDDDKHGPNFDHSYSGKSGSGAVPVKIKSSFGKVILGEPAADDMKSKNKNKTKTT
ncbi:MAG: hypothetical protein JST86_16565 [Bacteroidetes bacterium]|nr:hypothetical protein [Bacteroidota bacterium]